MPSGERLCAGGSTVPAGGPDPRAAAGEHGEDRRGQRL